MRQDKEEEIIRLYVNEGLSLKEIAKKLGIFYVKEVGHVLDRHNIPRRGGDARDFVVRQDKEEEEIIRLYVDEGLMLREIAKKLGIFYVKEVGHVLDRHNIPRRGGDARRYRAPRMQVLVDNLSTSTLLRMLSTPLLAVLPLLREAAFTHVEMPVSFTEFDYYYQVLEHWLEYLEQLQGGFDVRLKLPPEVEEAITNLSELQESAPVAAPVEIPPARIGARNVLKALEALIALEGGFENENLSFIVKELLGAAHAMELHATGVEYTYEAEPEPHMKLPDFTDKWIEDWLVDWIALARERQWTQQQRTRMGDKWRRRGGLPSYNWV